MSAHRLGRVLALALVAGVLVPGAIGSAGAVVVDRLVFYNNSGFDGNNPAINAADDGAIATDKTALLPGQTATFANVTSYVLGLNGLMVDIAGAVGGVTAADFSFRAGTTADPAAWAAAPAPSATAVRNLGGGVNRVTVTWNDFALVDTWLQATVLATAATGLAAPDVFYFGNLIGETGDDASALAVTAADATAIDSNAATPAAVDNPYDIDRDGDVDGADAGIARQHAGQTLPLFEAPVPGTGSRPIPEPGTLALLAFGLAGFGVLRRRRR